MPRAILTVDRVLFAEPPGLRLHRPAKAGPAAHFDRNERYAYFRAQDTRWHKRNSVSASILAPPTARWPLRRSTKRLRERRYFRFRSWRRSRRSLRRLPSPLFSICLLRRKPTICPAQARRATDGYRAAWREKKRQNRPVVSRTLPSPGFAIMLLIARHRFYPGDQTRSFLRKGSLQFRPRRF